MMSPKKVGGVQQGGGMLLRAGYVGRNTTDYPLKFHTLFILFILVEQVCFFQFEISIKSLFCHTSQFLIMTPVFFNVLTHFFVAVFIIHELIFYVSTFTFTNEIMVLIMHCLILY